MIQRLAPTHDKHLVHGRRRLLDVRRPRPVRRAVRAAGPLRAAAHVHRRLARRRLGGQARPRPGAGRDGHAPAPGRRVLAEQVLRHRRRRDRLPERRVEAQGAHHRRPDDLLRPGPAAAAGRRDPVGQDPPLRRAAGHAGRAARPDRALHRPRRRVLHPARLARRDADPLHPARAADAHPRRAAARWSTTATTRTSARSRRCR